MKKLQIEEYEDWNVIIPQKYCHYRLPKFEICSLLSKQCCKIDCPIRDKKL